MGIWGLNHLVILFYNSTKFLIILQPKLKKPKRPSRPGNFISLIISCPALAPFYPHPPSPVSTSQPHPHPAGLKEFGGFDERVGVYEDLW
jgi:hypothetical protein